MCFGEGRAKRDVLNLGARLIDASARVNVDVVDWPPIVNKSGVRRGKRNRVHPTRGRGARIVGLNRRAQVARVTRQTVERVAIMDLRILDLDVGC